MKALIIAAAALLPVYIVADIYRFVFYRTRSRLSTLLLDTKNHEPDYYVWRDANAERLRSRPHERWTMRSNRGEELCGFYYRCGEEPSKRLAFIVHGYRSEHTETAGMLADYYFSRGFDLFCPDNTASGQSGGKFFGYGLFESADCLNWFSELKNRLGDVSVVLHGFSLGAASVLMASDRVPDNVAFIVADSGFIDASEILKKQLGPLYGLMRRLNRRIAGYDPQTAEVRKHIVSARCPVLIAHGEDDPTVPFSMAPRIFELLPQPKDKLFSPGVRHIETSWRCMGAYAKKLDAFIKDYIR